MRPHFNRIGVALIMVLSLFSSCANRSPEAKFWAWFEKNEDMLFHFDRDQERVFDRLSEAMWKVHTDLTFEFGPDENGRREFVISAGGIRGAFPAVRSLHAAAPELPRWEFIAFRPRRAPMGLCFDDLSVSPEDVAVTIQQDGPLAGLTVLMRDYKETEDSIYKQAGYIMLDQALGEFDVETKVGFIEFKDMQAPSPHLKYSLADLPAAFDAFMRENVGGD